VKFGGKGKRKQCCQLRKCIKPMSPTKQNSANSVMQIEEERSKTVVTEQHNKSIITAIQIKNKYKRYSKRKFEENSSVAAKRLRLMQDNTTSADTSSSTISATAQNTKVFKHTYNAQHYFLYMTGYEWTRCSSTRYVRTLPPKQYSCMKTII